jgi:pterin-4a-carbinolamine dehydratase
MFNRVNARAFSFFNNKISQKYGEKCCRYGQNGKPLDRQTIDQVHATIKPFIEGWKLNDKYTMLYRAFWGQDYMKMMNFIQEIAKMDSLSTKNNPNFVMKQGELLRIELYSASLGGLSQIDFQLAMNINRMEFDDYFVIPVEDEVNYRREVRMKKNERQSLNIQQMLSQQFNSETGKIENKGEKSSSA